MFHLKINKKKKDKTLEQQLSGDRQTTQKRIWSHGSKDDPRSWKKNGCTDWEDTRNAWQRPRRTKEHTKWIIQIPEIKNVLEATNSKISEEYVI